MVLNRYEYSKIPNARLPKAWQSQADLDGLEDFLQKNWAERAFFYNDEKLESQQQFLKFIGRQSVRTNKYIGTIVYKGEQLNIYPRVFSTEKDDHETDDLDQQHLLKNLIRWLEYCNKQDYPFIHIASDFQEADNLKELFISLYIGYVRRALDYSMYFQYVDTSEDISNIKGKFDIRDYFSHKLPSGHFEKFRCTYSKFEFDNPVNRIIKYTCRQLLNISSPKNQKKIRNILNRLNDVDDVPCTPQDCERIRLGSIHRNYMIIISMSKMFLLNKVSNYSIDLNESFCFLFPTDLLFEGFIGGFMQEVVEKKGGKVRLQESSMRLVDEIVYKNEISGAAFTMRHDILAEVNGQVFVLDTKYKEISRFDGNPEYRKTLTDEANQSDLYQVLEYARKRGIEDVYLLYPMYRYEPSESEFPAAISKDPKGNINVHFIRMPFVFEEDEENTRNQLVKVINQMFFP